MHAGVVSVWILDNFRRGQEENPRWALSMGNSIELVVRIRHVVRIGFIFKPALVRFGERMDFCLCGYGSRPNGRRKKGKLSRKTFLLS